MGNSSSATSAADDHHQLESLLEELYSRLRREVPSDAVLKLSGCSVVNQTDVELHLLKELKDRWAVVKLFMDGVKIWSNADAVVENCGSIIVKAEAKADGLVKLLSIPNQQKSSSKLRSSLKLMRNEIQEFALKIFGLEREIAQVVDSIIGSFSSIEVYNPLKDLYLWIKFAESTGKIMKRLDPEAFSHLERLTSFIRHVHLGSESGLGQGSSQIISDYFAYVGTEVFRAAYLCMSILELGSTHHRISESVYNINIANPKFLDLTVLCLNYFWRVGSNRQVSSVHWVELFLSTFFLKSKCKSDTFLRAGLGEMVIILTSRLEPTREEDECDLADIKQVIFGAIHPTHSNSGYHCSCLIVCWDVWLFKVGLFLKELRSVRTSGKVFFDRSAELQIQYLVNSLEELERYYPEWELECAEDNMLTKEVSGKVRSLYQSVGEKKNNEYVYMPRISISLLLSKVALLRVKPALMKLLNLNGILNAPLRNTFCFLLEHIKLFISAITVFEAENAVDEEKSFSRIESVCMRILYLCYLIQREKIENEKIEVASNDLLEEVQMVKKQLVLRIPKINFPNTFVGMGFIDRLLGNLLEMRKRKCDPFFGDHMEKFQVELDSLRSCIRRASQKGSELLEWEDFGARFTKLMYELEYVVDSIEVGIGAQWQHVLWTNNLEREIIIIKALAETLMQEKTCEAKCLFVPNNSRSMSRAAKSEADKGVVRLKDQEKVIIDRLTGGFCRRDIVLIVGMPGLGKTNLAQKVYDDPKVSYHFHHRAWCFVSQSYKKRDVLLKLLGDIQGLTDEICELSDPDLELKLWRCLKRNRYLIVLDDVWDVEAWKDLQTSFPEDRNGSRIMITSRLLKVSSDAMPGSSPHPLRTLSVDESWELLEMRIFHVERCPEELVQTGKEIAQQCKGLPLAVVAVAGILEKTEKKQRFWQKILEKLNTQVLDDPVTQCRSILEMSYNHLPNHLKECFLYFGVFQQDGDVQVKRLIQMWIAEGFIQGTEQNSLEKGGEDSLRDLIDRSLVMVSKRKSTGGVKACQMHDLLRDLCLTKSKEENFLQLITCDDEPYASFHNLYDGVDFDYNHPSNLLKYESYRLCSHLKRKLFVDSRPEGPCTRSLIFIASNDAYPRRPYNVSFICENFKLLRVLDLECINLGISFPVAIEFLVLLRYLALGGDLDSIPESISNLLKLETFIWKGLSGKVLLPDTFWCMTNLRHVHVKIQAAFNLLGDKFGSSILLDNLVTFSCPSLSYGEDTEKILRKLPNLLKLKCIFLESRDSSGNCNPFPRLGFLMHLESLSILYAGRDRNPGELNLPLSLRKLTLSRFRLSWSHMSTIGSLPNLEVLKLLSGSLEGLTWDMKEDEFQKLKFLKLDSMNIAGWNASSDHLPELEQLVLWNCKDLENVPDDFSGISTLQIIEVQRCSLSLEESVRNLQEVVEGLQVLISH